MPTLQLLPRAPGFGEQLGQSLGQLLGTAAGGTIGSKLQSHFQQKTNQKSGMALAQALGKPELAPLLSSLTPEQQKIVISEIGADTLAENLSQMQGLTKSQPPPESFSPKKDKKKIEEEVTPKEKIVEEEKIEPIKPPGGMISDEEFIELYKKTPAKHKQALLKERQQEKDRFEKQKSTGLKDTQKIRTEYAQESKAARKSLENKERMLEMIEKGNLSHPILAGVANWLPKGFRESLLTTDSLAYESALFEEFGVLKGMFPGQIRTAEIRLLEPKLASLYKNDEAKKEIISVAMEAGKKAMIRGEAAAEVEKEAPWLTAVQFEEEVEKRARKKEEKLGEEIVDKLNHIADKYSDFEMMNDREGRLKKVPKDQIEEAINSGYKLAK